MWFFSFCAEAFKTFPVLEELELLTCGITDISLNMNDFNKLQVSKEVYMHIQYVVFSSNGETLVRISKLLFGVPYTCI